MSKKTICDTKYSLCYVYGESENVFGFHIIVPYLLQIFDFIL